MFIIIFGMSAPRRQRLNDSAGRVLDCDCAEHRKRCRLLADGFRFLFRTTKTIKDIHNTIQFNCVEVMKVLLAQDH